MRKNFSLYEMDEILRKAGAERIDEKASKKLRDILEDSGCELVAKAKIYAKHAGRNFVNGEDIRLAATHNRLYANLLEPA